jgi:hypothetical protein
MLYGLGHISKNYNNPPRDHKETQKNPMVPKGQIGRLGDATWCRIWGASVSSRSTKRAPKQVSFYFHIFCSLNTHKKF